MAQDTLFTEFPVADQYNWSDAAYQWYTHHRPHVETLIGEEHTAYPPSGSDCGRPELWKASHWRWFFKLGDR
jgi:hypothetical protein